MQQRHPFGASTRRSSLERLISSPVNYHVMLVADVAGASLFLAWGWSRFSGSVVGAAVIIAAGFLIWGGVEYAVHRWLLHGRSTIATRAHARHHADPEALISLPAFLSTSLALAFYLTLSLTFDGGSAALAVFGLYAGYNYYAVLHHLLHRQRAIVGYVPALSRLEEAHRSHHRRSGGNYGVTTTWWDRVMQTTARPRDTSSRERA